MTGVTIRENRVQHSRYRLAAGTAVLAVCGWPLGSGVGLSASDGAPGPTTSLVSMAAPPVEAPHNVRLSVATLETDAGALYVEVRFFWDDLQISIMERTSNMEFELAETPEVDRTVEQYINDMLTLEIDGEPLQGRVTARGIQDAPRADEVMWWYRLEYPLSGAPERVYVKNRLLFNMFEDQRNILHVTTRSGRERAYYFSWAEEDVTVPLR